MRINIAYALNDGYAYGTAASIVSVCQNSELNDKEMCIYLCYFSLSSNVKQKFISLSNEFHFYLKFVDVNKYFSKQTILYEHGYLKKEMYIRLIIPDLITEITKFIYLDSDVVVLKNICDLYSIDISEYVFGAAKDLPDKQRSLEIRKMGLDPDIYFNSGVMLINAEKYRKDKVSQKCLKKLSKHTDLLCPDQDVLNMCCKNVKYLDLRWNFQWGQYVYGLNNLDKESCKLYRETMNDYYVIHYTSRNKPWNSFACPEYSKYFYRYVSFTPLWDDFMDSIMSFSIETNSDANMTEMINYQFINGRLGFGTIIKFIFAWIRFKINKKGKYNGTNFKK